MWGRSERIFSGWFDAVGQRLFDRRCPFSLLAGSGPHPLGVTDPIKCKRYGSPGGSPRALRILCTSWEFVI